MRTFSDASPGKPAPIAEASGKRKRAQPPPSSASVDQQARHRMIAECAYHRAEHRSFAGDNALEDCLEAEREIERALRH